MNDRSNSPSSLKSSSPQSPVFALLPLFGVLVRFIETFELAPPITSTVPPGDCALGEATESVIDPAKLATLRRLDDRFKWGDAARLGYSAACATPAVMSGLERASRTNKQHANEKIDPTFDFSSNRQFPPN